MELQSGSNTVPEREARRVSSEPRCPPAPPAASRSSCTAALAMAAARMMSVSSPPGPAGVKMGTRDGSYCLRKGRPSTRRSW